MPWIPGRTTLLARRDFFRFTGGVLLTAAAYNLLRLIPDRSGVPLPGALPFREFQGACLRCGLCLNACDQNAVQLDTLGYPYINGIHGWCNFCLRCIEVCPTGALLLEDPAQVVLGRAVIDQKRCLPWISSGCRRCVDVCQKLQNAVLLDTENRPYIDDALCSGCGACVAVCPQPAKDGSNTVFGKAVYLTSKI